MRSSKTIAISAMLYAMLFVQTYSKAEAVKFSSCKYIQETISEEANEWFNKTQKEKGKKILPYNKKEAMARLNDKWEYIDRTFDTESKILTYEAKEKGEALSIGLLGNCADILPEFVKRNIGYPLSLDNEKSKQSSKPFAV